MPTNIGPKIGIDGEKEFRSEINNIIQQQRTLASEMKAVSSSFSNATNSEKKNTDTKKVLNKQIEAQKQLVSKLTAGLEASTSKFGANDTKTLKWKQSLNNANAELNKMENQLHEVGHASDDTGQKALSFGQAMKASFAGNLMAMGLSKVIDGVKELGHAMVETGKEAIREFATFEQVSGGIETLFKDSADKVKEYAADAFQSAGLSANQYMETVTGFSASLISSLAGDTEKAAEMANMAITDMADNANKMGTDMSSIQHAYQGFAKQTFTMLDNLNKMGALAV